METKDGHIGNISYFNAIKFTARGGIRIRSKYRYVKEENLIEVYEIPYTTTTEAIMDKVAELIVDVLANTTATTTAAGTPGKAKYTLADGVADRTKAASAELLDANPLYPGLDVS